MSRQKSEQLFEEAKQYLPGGVNSPVRAFKSVNGSPIFFEKGKGAHVWDEDGNNKRWMVVTYTVQEEVTMMGVHKLHRY